MTIDQLQALREYIDAKADEAVHLARNGSVSYKFAEEKWENLLFHLQFPQED